MNRKRTITAVVAGAAIAAGVALAGCGASAQPLTYAPAAYGTAGHCYYVDDPAEAIALENAGLCPRSWVPTVIPLARHEEYWDYYDSPAYYGTYVPARVRTVYVSHERAFGTRYHAVIVTRSRLATYRSSSGQTVSGSHLTGKARFGSGTSFGSSGQRYGGGSGRTGTSSRSGTSSGPRSSSRSGGFGGGSGRSGGHR